MRGLYQSSKLHDSDDMILGSNDSIYKQQQSDKESFEDSYYIDEVTIIGKGNNSLVYFGQEKKGKKREVAIKIIEPLNQEEQSLLNNELTLLNLLKGEPYIIQLYENRLIDNKNYLIFEFCNNGTLKEYLNTSFEVQPERSKCEIYWNLLQALYSVHKNSILHGHINLNNIFMKENGNDLRLSGFNHSQSLTPSEDGLIKITGIKETQTPKDYFGKPYTLKSEIFSLGIVFYQIAKNKHPFQGSNNTFDEKTVDYEGLSQNLKDLLMKMLKIDPINRIDCSQIIDHKFFNLTDCFEFLGSQANILQSQKVIYNFYETLKYSDMDKISLESYKNRLQNMGNYQNQMNLDLNAALKYQTKDTQEIRFIPIGQQTGIERSFVKTNYFRMNGNDQLILSNNQNDGNLDQQITQQSFKDNSINWMNAIIDSSQKDRLFHENLLQASSDQMLQNSGFYNGTNIINQNEQAVNLSINVSNQCSQRRGFVNGTKNNNQGEQSVNQPIQESISLSTKLSLIPPSISKDASINTKETIDKQGNLLKQKLMNLPIIEIPFSEDQEHSKMQSACINQQNQIVPKYLESVIRTTNKKTTDQPRQDDFNSKDKPSLSPFQDIPNSEVPKKIQPSIQQNQLIVQEQNINHASQILTSKDEDYQELFQVIKYKSFSQPPLIQINTLNQLKLEEQDYIQQNYQEQLSKIPYETFSRMSVVRSQSNQQEETQYSKTISAKTELINQQVFEKNLTNLAQQIHPYQLMQQQFNQIPQNQPQQQHVQQGHYLFHQQQQPQQQQQFSERAIVIQLEQSEQQKKFVDPADIINKSSQEKPKFRRQINSNQLIASSVLNTLVTMHTNFKYFYLAMKNLNNLSAIGYSNNLKIQIYTDSALMVIAKQAKVMLSFIQSESSKQGFDILEFQNPQFTKSFNETILSDNTNLKKMQETASLNYEYQQCVTYSTFREYIDTYLKNRVPNEQANIAYNQYLRLIIIDVLIDLLDRQKVDFTNDKNKKPIEANIKKIFKDLHLRSVKYLSLCCCSVEIQTCLEHLEVKLENNLRTQGYITLFDLICKIDEKITIEINQDDSYENDWNRLQEKMGNLKQKEEIRIANSRISQNQESNIKEADIQTIRQSQRSELYRKFEFQANLQTKEIPIKYQFAIRLLRSLRNESYITKIQ